MRLFQAMDDGPRQRLMAMSLFQRLVADVDGWQELCATAERVDSLAPPTMFAADEERLWIRAADAFLAGKAVDDALTELHDYRSLLAASRDREEITTRARQALSSKALLWLDEHREAVTQIVDRHLRAIVDAARPTTRVQIRNRSQDQIAKDPAAGEAWLKIGAAADAFREAYALGEALAEPGRPDEGHLPDLWLFPNYETLWPRFFMNRPLELWDASSFSHILPAEKPEWSGMSKLELLTFIVETGTKVRAVDWLSLHAEQRDLAAKAEALRNDPGRLKDARSEQLHVYGEIA